MIVKWPNNRVWWSPRGPVVILLLLAYVVLSVDSAGAAAVSAPRSATLSHVVRPGETLSAIAAQYGLTEAALAQANGIANPSLIYAGQQLVIPTGGGIAAAPLPVAAPRAGEVAELAAIVYAEAQASPIDFNEMLAVASVIRNRVEHVAAYPIDRIWFGGSGYHGVVSNSREFPSYGTPRYWNFLAGTVGSGQEQVAAESAMQAAVQVYNGGSVYDFVFFQQAATRPSPRAAFTSTHLGAHNFWSFRPECINPLVPCS